MQDPYKILGVSRNASQDEIDEAYNKLVAKFHPDRNLNNKDYAEKKMFEINQAYNRIKNGDPENDFDQHEGDKEHFSSFNPFSQFGNANKSGFFNFGNFGKGGGVFDHFFRRFGESRSNEDSGFSGADHNYDSDSQVFGSNNTKNNQVNIPKDIILEIEKTLENSFNDIDTQITYDIMIFCLRCNGGETSMCSECKGRGENFFRTGSFMVNVTCRYCNGSGKRSKSCPACYSKGFTKKEKNSTS